MSVPSRCRGKNPPSASSSKYRGQYLTVFAKSSDDQASEFPSPKSSGCATTNSGIVAIRKSGGQFDPEFAKEDSREENTRKQQEEALCCRIGSGAVTGNHSGRALCELSVSHHLGESVDALDLARSYLSAELGDSVVAASFVVHLRVRSDV